MAGDELVARAREHAEAGGVPDEWGELLELEEGGGLFVGRYRGTVEDTSFDPPRAVYLLWRDGDGEPCFLRSRFRLLQEFDRERPQIGDRVAIVRGPDYETKSGNFGHAYGLSVEPCDAPLPGVVQADDIPF